MERAYLDNLQIDVAAYIYVLLQTNLDSVLKSRSKVIEQTYTVDMLHSHIGRLFSEWSVIEKYLGDGLQVRNIISFRTAVKLNVRTRGT